MDDAWAERRRAFDLPEAERLAALVSARAKLERAATVLRDADRPVAYAHALHLLAHVEQDAGDLEQAETLWIESVRVLRAADDPLQLAHKVRHLGDVVAGRGDLQRAVTHYEEALDLYRDNPGPDALAIANAVNRMAAVRERLGERDEARALWLDVRERYAALGIEEGVAEADEHLAALA